MKGLLEFFARNEIFSNIIIVLVLFSGIIALSSLIRENFPEFSLDMISVSIVYPGADPEEVESGVCQKIEEAVEGLDGIRQFTTFSRENVGTGMIEVKEGYDVKDVLTKVKTAVESVATFPKEAEKPVIYEVTAKSPVILLYLSGDMSERRIKEWSERVRSELKTLDKVSQVYIFGTRDYEIAVEVSEKKMREYGLNFATVSEAIRRSNLNLAGGTLRTQGEEIRLRTMGRRYSGEELANIVVLATPRGDSVTLGKVARIIDDFEEDPISAKIDGKPALMVMVFKTKDEDSLAIADEVTKFVEQKQAQLPRNVSLKILYDNTELLRARINLLIENGIQGLIVVVFFLWVFLNGRLALWVANGIPFSFAATVVVLWWLGETINMVSLFGLIMVLGIVVDDATVVAETIYVHRMAGIPPKAAAVKGLLEVALGVAASSATTVVTFMPLLFVKGVMGKFIAILPTVVITTLMVSLWEALFLLPAHLNHLPDPMEERKKAGVIGRKIDHFRDKVNLFMEWFENKIYIRFLSGLIPHRYLLFCVTIVCLMFTIGVIKGGMVKMILFGDVDGFIISSTVEFPEGTPPDVTKNAIEKIDEALKRLGAKTKTASGEPMIEHRLSLVGQTIEDVSRKGPNLGSVQAILLDSERRGIHFSDLMVQWEKEIGTIPGVKALTFAGMSSGPPGADIEVWFQGKDLEQLVAAGNDFKNRLRKFDGVFQIRSDYAPGKNEIRLKLRPEAAALGLTVEDLATQVYAGYYGNDVVRLQRGGEEVRVRVRYTAEERSNVTDFEQMRVRTMDGRMVPLNAVAQIEFQPGYSTITRTDGMRRVAVSAEVDTARANTNEIYKELSSDYFEGLKDRFPEVLVSLQGEEKQMMESMNSLAYGFPLGVVGVFVIMAATFRSYAQPFVIMITIPFGIVGAVFGHLFLGYDYSLMSIFGTVAVSGIVVNDAIVLVEKINDNLAEGMPFFGAVILGSSRRFRAVMLTTATTVAGLAPLILETDFQAKFLIPMAIALAAGNLFSTFLVIVQMPCLMVILNDIRRWLFFRKHGYWPTRNEVEPATYRYVKEEGEDEGMPLLEGGDKRHLALP